jgi:hypothetical protein
MIAENTKDMQQKELRGANTKTPIKANFTKNFGLGTNNQFFGPIRLLALPILLDLPMLPVLSNLPNLPGLKELSTFSKISVLPNLLEILKQPIIYLFLDDNIEQLLENKHTCRNPSLGLMTKARVCKNMGQ